MSHADASIADEIAEAHSSAPVPVSEGPAPADKPRYHITPQKQTWVDRVEAFISKLSVRDNFWNSVCSLIWLPLAFFSGIKMKDWAATKILASAGHPFP